MSDAVEIRGNRYTLMTLALQSTDHALIARALHIRIRQAPAFLANTPVIVDFSAVGIAQDYNFNLLFKVIRQQRLLPVAVRGLPEHMNDQLQSMGVPVVELSVSSTVVTADTPQGIGPDVTVGAAGETLLVDRTLRAGERCYARDADLIVVGDSRADTELLADGHIHVYGVLRGRVVAGFSGNTAAQVFCHALETAAVSIAGVGPAGLPQTQLLSGPVQIQLYKNGLVASSLAAG